jgi:hypothetical protein
MNYIMSLSIIGADNTVIAVVNSSVAHKRGGASPVPRVVLYYIACSLIFRQRFFGWNQEFTEGNANDEEGYSRELP